MPTIVIIEDNKERLDLLVIGTSHDIAHKEWMRDFPELLSNYLSTDDPAVTLIFTSLLPRMTLIYGELSKKSAGKSNELTALNLALLNRLLELKQPEQKILIAGYFKSDNPHFLQLPASNKYIMRKFAEMK